MVVLHNTNFNSIELDAFRNQAGLQTHGVRNDVQY